MASNDEITSVQSFTERTLKYGRNQMAVTVPIFVFALVPVVDLANSRPLNFAIHEGGEIWIWRILLALLAYYGFRFFGLAIPDFLHWKTKFGEHRAGMKSKLNAMFNNERSFITEIERARRAFDNTTDKDHQEAHRAQIGTAKSRLKDCQNHIRATRSEIRIYNWRRTYFWFADAGLPTVLFGLALWASLDKIFMLHCLEIPLNCAGGETP